jgi:hypothetical protein
MPYLELDTMSGNLVAYMKEARIDVTNVEAAPNYYKGRGGIKFIPLSSILIVDYVEGAYRVTDASVEPEPPAPTGSYGVGSLVVTLITGATVRFDGNEYSNVKDIAEDFCTYLGVTYIDPLSFPDELTTP